MDASDWIALAALVIAAASFWASQRERRERSEAIARESNHRAAELGLLETQLELQRAGRNEQLRAELSATPGRVDGGINGGRFDRHTFRITNAGPSHARNLSFWTLGDTSDIVVGDTTLDVLLAETSEEIDIDIPMPESRKGGLRLHARWQDGTGFREQDLVEIKRHG